MLLKPHARQPRYLFQATGSVLRFAGFLSVYIEGRDDGEVDDDGKQRLPELASGEPLDLIALQIRQMRKRLMREVRQRLL